MFLSLVKLSQHQITSVTSSANPPDLRDPLSFLTHGLPLEAADARSPKT